MNFLDTVAAAFGPTGALAIADPRFSSRVGQAQMAHAIAQNLEAGGSLVVEAGTGVGKTFAYLVPVLLSGKRALISTATKALQDQLALRDLPRLRSAFGIQVRVSVLKGRSSYLCLNRLAEARQHPIAAEQRYQCDLAHIDRWSTVTKTGDLAEVMDFADRSPLESVVTSTRDNCLGSACPQAASCFVNLARSAAIASDIVVVNHHLFFADLNVRESGVAELLPNTDVVVFDEAHQLNDIGVQFLARQISTRQLEDLARDLLKQSAALSLGTVDWRYWVADIERACARLRAFGERLDGQTNVAWQGVTPSGLAEDAWTTATVPILNALLRLSELLARLSDLSPELAALGRRLESFSRDLAYILTPAIEGHVRWLQCGRHLKMLCAPLEIRVNFQSHMDPGTNLEAAKKSWIFTSATLGVDSGLMQFRAACGLSTATVLQVNSPFNYFEQAAVYVPNDFPLPSDALHSVEVAHLATQAARVLGGRTLVLTTTLRAMQVIGDSLKAHLAVTSGIEVMVQGEASKREILERFTAVREKDQFGIVVVASASFWEGVDIPGDALQLVIIDKIPFSPPDAPLTRARTEQVLAGGKNPFRELHLPQAALGLKQGAGRLIRSEHDKGLLVICDPRLVHAAYGKKLVAALPPMRRISDRTQFFTELEKLTRLSTKDPYWS